MKQLSVLILLVIMQLTVFSQNTYIMQLNKTLSNSNVSVIPTANEEIAIWMSNDLELYKFDKCGNNLWNKQFTFPDFTSSCIQNEMIAIKSGGYAFLTRETTGAVVSSRVTKLNASGNILWSKVYTIPSYTICSYSLMEDGSGNLFIFGNTNQLGGGTADNILIKLQANGTEIWSKTYNNGGTWGQAILTSDNGCLFRTGSLIKKLNSLGNIEWTSQNLGPSLYFNFAPVEVRDGYIFATSASNGTDSIKFLKIDKSGNQLWGGAKVLNFSGVNRKLLKKSNGNIVSVFNKTVNGKNLPTIIEFDKDLNVISTSSLQISESNIELSGYDINFMNNETPVLTGTADSLGSSKPFIAKLNTDYQSGCDTILPISFGTGTATNSLINTIVQPKSITVVNSIFNPTPFSITTSFLCYSSQLSINLGEDAMLCPNSSITLKNLTSSLYDKFVWSTGETTSSITTNKSGNYWVSATDNCTGITLSDTINVTIQNFPNPTKLSADTILCLDNSILLDAQHIGGIYKWQDGSVEQYFEALIPDLYYVDITYEGCRKRFYSEVRGCEEYIIPNVFTPNGDGLNDFFEIIYNGDENYNLIIYNRWGQQIFESNDKTRFWKGNVNGKDAAAGCYYYVFSLGDQTLKGSLTLFR